MSTRKRPEAQTEVRGKAILTEVREDPTVFVTDAEGRVVDFVAVVDLRTGDYQVHGACGTKRAAKITLAFEHAS